MNAFNSTFIFHSKSFKLRQFADSNLLDDAATSKYNIVSKPQLDLKRTL